MDTDTVQSVRLKAFEEMRQYLKHVNWPIGSLIIVEDAVKTLSSKSPDKRYDKITRVYQD